MLCQFQAGLSSDNMGTYGSSGDDIVRGKKPEALFAEAMGTDESASKDELGKIACLDTTYFIQD